MIKKILSLSLTLLTLSLIFKSSALAATDLKDITVARDEVLNGLYLNTGDNVTISGTINGDTYLGGGVITVAGTINGDLFVGGGVVTITGRVSDDVRVAGGIVTIDGEVGKNVTALGGTVTIGTEGRVGKSVLMIGGNVSILGEVGEEARLYADTISLGGKIGGNTQIGATKLNVAKTAILSGNLNYTSESEATISNQAQIAGTVKKNLPRQLVPKAPRSAKGFGRAIFGFRVLSYLSLLLIGAILLKLTPRQTTAAAKLIGEQPWKSLGLGFLTVVLTPILAVFLGLTIIGIPLAVVVFGLYVLMIALSSIFTGLFVGQKVFDLANLQKNQYLILALGMLLIKLVFALPVIGFFAKALSVLAAVGALVILQQHALKRLMT